jgi:tetratricopeptide (TPR) repeat protein
MEEDQLSHNNIEKNPYKLPMKKIFVLLFVLSLNNHVFGAGGDSGSSGSSNTSETALYDQAVKLLKRAGKLEKKDKDEKAKKLFSQAFEKLEKAYSSDKNNPDILNYMGYTSRKVGNFDKAEKFYLKGLSLKPNHNGINEYLGELYVQTNRIDKANERLAVLKNCNCEEYQDLELIIKTKGTKIY